MYIKLTSGHVIYTSWITTTSQGIKWAVPDVVNQSFAQLGEIVSISDNHPDA